MACYSDGSDHHIVGEVPISPPLNETIQEDGFRNKGCNNMHTAKSFLSAELEQKDDFHLLTMPG